MVNYIIRRTFYGIILLFAVSLISFLLINLPPGDYLSTMITTMKSQGGLSNEEAEQIAEQMREAYDLNKPLLVQYKTWIVNIITKGDFGFSFVYRGPVNEILVKKIGWTLVVSLGSLVFAFVIGIIVGIYSATHQYTLTDNIFTVLSFLGLSIPNFFFAIVLMFILVVFFDVPSVGGLFSTKYIIAPWSFARFIDLLKHLWLPILVVGTAGTARNMRVMRGNLLDILGMQYIQVARAKGLKETVVIYKHAVRNALQPMIMFAGMTMPFLLQGALITSIVLNLPTMGPVFYDAIVSQDMYLAGSYMLFIALFLVIGNLLADIALVFVDPRIRYD